MAGEDDRGRANERTAPLRSGWCDESLDCAPPSEEPTLTSITTSRAESSRPARTSGSSARFEAVALQPTPLT